MHVCAPSNGATGPLLRPGCVSERLVRREVKLGSFTARLHSGVQMSYSFYGPTGESSGQSSEQV